MAEDEGPTPAAASQKQKDIRSAQDTCIKDVFKSLTMSFVDRLDFLQERVVSSLKVRDEQFQKLLTGDSR